MEALADMEPAAKEKYIVYQKGRGTYRFEMKLSGKNELAPARSTQAAAISDREGILALPPSARLAAFATLREAVATQGGAERRWPRKAALREATQDDRAIVQLEHELVLEAGSSPCLRFFF